MRTALHSWSFRDRFEKEPDFNIFQALDLTAEMGFTGIEIMGGSAGSPPGQFGNDDTKHIAKICKYAENLGIQIDSFAPYNDFAFTPNEEWRLANIAYIKQWLQIAGDAGIPNIRMLTGYYVEGEDRAKLERLVREGIAECVPYAEKAGVNMALENHSSVILSGADIIALIKSIGSPRLTTCPDPTNWCHGVATEADLENMYANLALIAPLATQSHLKIKGITEDGELIGYDINRIAGIYRTAGYDGALAFESVVDGDLIAPLARAREIVEAALKQ